MRTLDRFRAAGLMLALMVCALASPLDAQKKNKDEDRNTRTLTGVVTMEDGNPAEGAVVKLKNMKTLQVLSFITKKDGHYRFGGLSLDVDYEVRADLSDTASQPKTLSVFDNRKAAILNLKLEKAEKK